MWESKSSDGNVRGLSAGYVLSVEARHKSVIPVSDAEEISFGEQPIARGRFWNGIQSFLGRIPYDCGLTN
ncbi:MAG: hypothetical protein DMG08_22485 [Acidobacteria bacterium]|nr:MAG: hypothetical protein DMG08_22485 [Acidobacteriota bacterium]PYU99483.1 MAG: hypothetical protein DMG10_24760 [Acidobacteriota bacterium]PYV36932.1 MAG: hypothetical protein DMG09_16050 [Acidobacteriota bacterium]